MKTINVFKAGGIGDTKVEDVTIIIATEFPEMSPDDTYQDMMTAHELNAKVVVNALCTALPGGTLDRVICQLLERKASLFRVPLFDEPKNKSED